MGRAVSKLRANLPLRLACCLASCAPCPSLPNTLRGPWPVFPELTRRAAACAGAALVFCTACNLASPVMTGLLFETLVGRQPLARYPRYLALLAVMYVAEPLVTRVYIRNACAAGEKARPGRSPWAVGSGQGPLLPSLVACGYARSAYAATFR